MQQELLKQSRNGDVQIPVHDYFIPLPRLLVPPLTLVQSQC